ncbi:MAG TPA: hypothetical protein VF544_08855 [Pyrinomonadaceae bacterium]
MRVLKPVLKIMSVAGLLAGLAAPALAQCAMCKAAVANSAEAGRAASGMNLGVLVLLVPPVLLFCAFIVVLYRYRKAPDEAGTSRAGSAGGEGAGAHLKEEDERAAMKLRAGGPAHA